MPVLEKMCREGIVFDNFYANPLCSPTRATMMTGRYSFRTGVGTVVRRGGAPGLKLSEQTIFQFLDRRTSKRYAHAVIGKWHLADAGNGAARHPNKAGAGYYAGVLRGAVRDHYNWPRTKDGATARVAKYITTALTDEAGQWINRQRKPWFMWLAHVAPHLPLHLPPKNLHGRFELNGAAADIRARALDYYFAALEALDSEIGRLLAQMPKAIRDNTLVLFLGDNGTPPRVSQSYRRSRTKGSVFEGGVHVPLVAWGRGVVRRGAREKALINTTDIFATVAELAGVDLAQAKPPVDSISFAPLLSRAEKTGREFAYAEHFGPANQPAAVLRGQLGPRRRIRLSDLYGWTIRDARWKYVQLQRGRAMLFDLLRDPLERTDLLTSSPSLAKDAFAALIRLKAKAKTLRGK